jgi:4-hydroxy-tetrahydrodipicolinate synthase
MGMLHGVFTAVITPFRDGAVDRTAFRSLIQRQLDASVEGIVVCGSTGEAATMTQQERDEVCRIGIEMCQGTSTTCWIGTGTNNTATSIEATQRAQEMGATGAMIVAPYYNKPSQEGLFQHFAAVAKHCNIPLILYNVPGRTGVSVDPETIARVHELGRYAALKEASGSLDHASDVRALCDMTILSGDDSLTLPMLSIGARGVISVVSNLVPGETRQMVHAFLNGDTQEAATWHLRLLPFFRGAFIETNPAPMKMLLALEGHCTPETRLPLVPATEGARRHLESLLQESAWRKVGT